MGLIDCPIHGESGLKNNVDRDIVTRILNNAFIDANDMVLIKTYCFLDEKLGGFEQSFLIRRETVEANGFKLFYSTDDEGEYTEYVSRVSNLCSGICVQCYNDFFERYALKI